MGDYGVGKSSLIKRYVYNTYGDSLTSRLLARESLKYLSFKPAVGSGEVKVRLSIKDIGNIKHPHEIDNLFIDDVNGILLVCDLTNQNSFLNFDNWIDEIKELPSLNCLMMVGNKQDVSMRDRAIEVRDLESYADHYNTRLYLTSAKSGDGVEDAFNAITRVCVETDLGINLQSRSGLPVKGPKGDLGGGTRHLAGGVNIPKPEMTMAQRTLVEMRQQRKSSLSGRHTADYMDQMGDIHLKYGGYCYLVKEDKAEKSFRAYAEMLEQELEGLCIARQYPDDVREEYDLGQVPIYWLTRSGTESTHLSVNLSRLSSFIKKFLDETEKPVLMLEGIEYLIIQNDFTSVLKFVQLIIEYIRMKRACFIMPINPNVLESRDLSLLEREMTVIKT
jgi:GTPase SAR1 family protein